MFLEVLRIIEIAFPMTFFDICRNKNNVTLSLRLDARGFQAVYCAFLHHLLL